MIARQRTATAANAPILCASWHTRAAGRAAP